MKKISVILEAEFHNHYRKVGREPISIIANPLTVQNLYLELLQTMNIPYPITEFKYRGAKIYRSMDIEENKFIIG